MWRDGYNGKASAVIGWRSCPLGGTLIQHRHEPIRSDRLRVARYRAAAAQHPVQEQSALETLLQQAPLPRAQPDRALLLEAEALPPRRYPLRQARRQLPRNGPTRLDAAVAPSL